MIIKVYISTPNYGHSIDEINNTKARVLSKLEHAIPRDTLAKGAKIEYINSDIISIISRDSSPSERIEGLENRIKLMKKANYIVFVKHWLDCDICDIERYIALHFAMPNIITYTTEGNKEAPKVAY